MPRSYHRWILTQAREYQPEGTLRLGQILAKPFEPGYTLMPGGPLPIPASILQETSSQDGVSTGSDSDLTAMFDLWANVAGAPVAGKVDAKMDRSARLAWRFDSLRNTIMSPSLEYVTAAMQHGDVPEFLGRWRFQKRVYMITGVRTAYGASMDRADSRSVGLQAKAEADLTAVGAPATVGAKTGVTASSASAESFEKASAFVYAYRLNEVNYRGKLTQKPFTKGETSGVGGAGEGGVETAASQSEPGMVGFEVEGLEEEDFDGGEFEVKAFDLSSVQDEDVEYECLIAA